MNTLLRIRSFWIDLAPTTWAHAWKTTLAVALFASVSVSAVYANGPGGRVSGTLVDAENGDPLIGANVFLQDTMIGAASDLDGKYAISRIPPGNYNLVVSMMGYAKHVLTGVKVVAGEVTLANASLQPEVLASEDVVVTAKLIRNTESALLKERQKATAVSDAISSEAIARTGSGDAAEAMTKVTGASVVDGKYVYIRGLGERYSSTTLNGTELPSADPERKAVQMDLFPANLLENIVTTKSFTPDRPGNFSGGAVDIGTKSYPESFSLKVSNSVGANTESTFGSDYLTYTGGDKDWLGMDDGSRSLPDELKGGKATVPTLAQARRNAESARQLDQVSKAFTPVMAPNEDSAPVNQSYAFSVGNQTTFLGRPLGYIGSFSYKRNYSSYANGQSERWQLGTSVTTTDSLTPKVTLADSKGVDDVTWGGLATLSSKIHANHELTANFYYSQSGESSSRRLLGSWQEQFGLESATLFETRVLKYAERNLQSYQLSGEHYFPALLRTKADWKAAYTSNSQEEPDTRYFSDHFSERKFAGRDTVLYNITPSIYSQPARYFRKLNEDGLNLSLDFAIPVRQWSGHRGKFRFGGAYTRKDRDFNEIRYQYNRPSALRYAGNEESFFSNENVGIVGFDSTRSEFLFGNYIELSPDPRGGDYSGQQKVSATYAMVELPLTRRLKFVGGARFEATRMEVVGADSTQPDSLRIGRIDADDVLPSANFVYQLGTNMNLRAAYGRTLARPTLREMAPYANFEFVNDYTFTGNINLERSLIDNFDLRWEWFARPGEIYAVSGFFKKFHDPIERTIIGASSADNPEISFQNVDEGRVLGLEFEVRKSLDQVASLLRNFALGMNLTLVHSEVDIPKDKLQKIEERDPDGLELDRSRPLQGQSPYLLNLDLSYSSRYSGTSVDLNYNLFGDRLSDVTSDATPDVYEVGRASLNINTSQKLYRGLSLKISAKNILNSSVEFIHEYKNAEYTRTRYKPGRSYAVGLSYAVQ